MWVYFLHSRQRMDKYSRLVMYSDPEQAQRRAHAYLGKRWGKLWISDRPEKKYMVWDPRRQRMVHFGQMGYEDYTRHRDARRRQSYLARTAGIRGPWREDLYSANNLSRHILW